MGLNGGTFSELRRQILLLRRPWMGEESQIEAQKNWGQRFKHLSSIHGSRMDTLRNLYGEPETGPNEGMGEPTIRTKSDNRFKPYGGGSKQKRRKKSRKSRRNTLKKRPRKTLKKRSKRSKRSTKRR